MTKKKLKEIIKIKNELEKVKDLYKRLDALTDEFIQSEALSAECGGYQIILLDNFSDKNTYFKLQGIKRYEIKLQKKAS